MKKLPPLSTLLALIFTALLLAACGMTENNGKEQEPGLSTGGSAGQTVTTGQPINQPAPAIRPRVEEKDSSALAPVRSQVMKAETGLEHKKQMNHEAYRMDSISLADIRQPSAGVNRDRFGKIDENGVKAVIQEPVSTFSIDVDSGAYALVRRSLNQGQLPVTDAVRVEELINYFDYDYPVPDDRQQPFSVTTEISRTPWNRRTHLLHVGIKGIEIDKDQRPASNLVFLLDVSGSMNSPDKLPLLKSAFRLLVKQLNAHDRVTMVVYAGASGVVLEPTAGNEQGKILAALDRLTAGGSTHGSAGIQLAYAMALQEFIKDGINRVILATDGDFNVGTVNHEQLMDLIEEKRRHGISLTTLGFGQGNYNDYLMEQLADKGNGNYAYIDSINEAHKVLVDELTSTLETIARDVKIQIEWNPEVVAEYRLIGYENRMLAREDFSNDKVDAGDIGAGHSVTALYEITLTDGDRRRLEPLRYDRSTDAGKSASNEIAFLRLRYKAPDADRSRLIERPIYRNSIIKDVARTSDNFRFSAAVAGFGQLLRGGRYTESFDYSDVARLAGNARGQDNFGYRGEFLRLVNLAGSLDS
jgi:Ca-activated chloride channel family protein